MKMSRKRRRTIVAWAIAIGGMESCAARMKVQTIEPYAYEMWADEIRTTAHWKYGFLCGHHGCVLAKTRNLGPSYRPVRDEVEPAVRDAMAEELRRVPRKIVGELALYAVLVWWGCVFTPWLRLRSRGWSRRRVLWHATGAVGGLGFLLLASTPYLVFRLGAPLFSNWVGPGALSYTTGLGLTGGPGLTVSYRSFLELVFLGPIYVLMLVDLLVGLVPGLSDSVRPVLDLVVAWAIVGVSWRPVVRACRAGLRRLFPTFWSAYRWWIRRWLAGRSRRAVGVLSGG
ncbi:MAG: hypothetical protein U0610_20320 [bacterium]